MHWARLPWLVVSEIKPFLEFLFKKQTAAFLDMPRVTKTSIDDAMILQGINTGEVCLCDYIILLRIRIFT